MTQPATDETTISTTDARTFEVEVLLTVTVTGAEDVARTEVDQILQRAWDTDKGRYHVQDWHFELLDDGLVTDVTDEI